MILGLKEMAKCFGDHHMIVREQHSRFIHNLYLRRELGPEAGKRNTKNGCHSEECLLIEAERS